MWFYLALLSALFNAIGNIARRTHGSLAQPAELAWWSLLLSLPLGLGLLLVSNEPLWTSTDYLLPIIITAIFSAVGSILIFRAYKYGEASAISPIGNILPVLIVFTSFIILGIVPSPLAFVGILMVAGGVYYSSVSGKHSLSHPLKQLLKNRGSKAMLGWVVLMAFSTVFMQIALRSAAPSYLLFFHQVAEFILISVYLLTRPQHKRIKHGERVFKKWGWHLAAISVFSTLGVFFQLQAMNLIDPSYVISVKRLDVIFTILLAGYFLKERHIMRRFKGSVIAVLGVAIIFIFS